ncbi:hypothetical protein [Nostoc commune]|uniref:hypothetical protein n=1 Tax=Nostoc commune TaxID=1178 RepID=UPI0015E7EEC3|nr:hypothetical protein [Nostoc commune]
MSVSPICATMSLPYRVNIKIAAIAQEHRIKKTCLAPMKATTLRAIPGLSTPKLISSARKSDRL